VEARIDTGGELLTLSPDVAEAIGVHAVVSVEGVFAAGRLSHRYGRFPVRRVGLGRLVPDEWAELDGIRIHGIVSHGFLRRYAWTLDFERMTMTFAT
jgi:hypothetical protein